MKQLMLLLLSSALSLVCMYVCILSCCVLPLPVCVHVTGKLDTL